MRPVGFVTAAGFDQRHLSAADKCIVKPGTQEPSTREMRNAAMMLFEPIESGSRVNLRKCCQ